MRSAFLLCLAACATSAAAQRPAGSPTARLPFAQRDGLIFLAADIGRGAPLTLVLDTGASPCVLDGAAAARLRVGSRPSDRQGRGGAGNFTSNYAIEAIAFRIGATRTACHETIVLDLSGLTEVVGRRIDGVAGGDFFRNRVVSIDYDRRVVELFDRRRHPFGARNRIPIRINGNRPHVIARLSVTGGPQDIPHDLIVDTGSRDNVDHPMLAQSSEPSRSVAATGLGTGYTARTGTFSRVQIGPHRFARVSGVVPAVPIVGAGILGRFNLVFDYDGGWMLMRPRRGRRG